MVVARSTTGHTAGTYVRNKRMQRNRCHQVIGALVSKQLSAATTREANPHARLCCDLHSLRRCGLRMLHCQHCNLPLLPKSIPCRCNRATRMTWRPTVDRQVRRWSGAMNLPVCCHVCCPVRANSHYQPRQHLERRANPRVATTAGRNVRPLRFG